MSITKNVLFDHINPNLYDLDGFVDYNKLTEFLKIKKVYLIKAIGTSPRTVEKNPHSQSVQDPLKKIVYIFSLLDEMLESQQEILTWLKAPQVRFNGKAPLDVIREGEMDLIIDYLYDIKYDYVPELSFEQAAKNAKRFIKTLPKDLIDIDID